MLVLATLSLHGCDRSIPPETAAVDGGAESRRAPSRIFLITIDTLRADHLGAYGYERDTSPFLDSLAQQGTLFERAFVQWPKTGPSFASIFTGLYPGTTGLKAKAAITLPAEQETLAELLSRHGYSTVAVVGNAVLDSELGWDQGFDEYIEPWKLSETPPVTPNEWKRTLDATQVTAHATELLESHRDTERLFAWIHYMDPHVPYVLPPGETNPFLGEVPPADGDEERHIPKSVLLDGRTDLEFYRSQYDANIAVADRWIGTLFDRLRELSLLEDSLIIVTSDHGESLGERNYFGHGKHPYNNTLHVPLLFVDSRALESSASPSRVEAGLRVAEPVELVDLFPTLEEIVEEARPSRESDGQSLVPFLRGEVERAAVGFRYAFSEAGVSSKRTYRIVQDGERKLIFHPGRREGRESYEVYDLEADPRERRELQRSGEPVPEELKEELADWMSRTLTEAEADGPLQPEIQRALEALGYVN